MKKNGLIATLVFCLVMGSFSGCSAKKNTVADLVVYGTIFTAEDENDGLAEAFAVKDGKFIYVGNKDGAKEYIEDGKTEIIDRTDRGLIIPGATEGHGHYFDGTGLASYLPGSGCSYEELLKIIKEQAETKGISQFVSFGWKTESLFEKRTSGYNFAEEIEKAAPGIPVVLLSNDGHAALCNTTALKKVGLLENPTVRGGIVDLDKNGKPSGYLGDQAVYYVLGKAISNPFTEEQYRNACLYASNRLLELGYTNALDAFTNMYDPEGLYEAINALDKSGELNINVAGSYAIHSYDAENYRQKVDEVAGIAEKYKSTHFNPAYIKLFADGVVETTTGWISGEYKNVEKGMEHGNIIWTEDELKAITRYANGKGITIHTHSFGDAACTATINAYIAANEVNKEAYRNCLAHVRNIKPEDVIRVAENKIPVAENLLWHLDYDENDPEQKEIKELIISKIGEELYYSGYPMKSLMDKGVILSSSTDAPAAEFITGTIMNVLEIATTGRLPHDPMEAFSTEELLSVREGLKALTINGAWQLGLENERGSIKVGKYADFVILDKNILDYTGEQLRTIGDTKILNTYFEGKKVYTAE